MSVPIIRRLGKYEVLEEIGRGGMSAVYRGQDTVLKRPVAVKILAAHLVWDESFVERFLREAQMAARLDHPNIVTIFDVGRQQDTYYLVMRLVKGESLKELIAREGPLAPWHAAAILEQVAGALDHAHDQGLVHRDIKPSNILVDERGPVTLTDFGIARAADGTKLTATGLLIGTPEYMSPEQARGEVPDGRSDVYSLGIVLYEMLTGRVPFSGDTPLGTLFQHVQAPIRPARELIPDLPAAVETVLARVLSKNASDRYQRAGLLAGAFSRVLEDTSGEARSPSAAVAVPGPAQADDTVTRLRAPERDATHVRQPAVAVGDTSHTDRLAEPYAELERAVAEEDWPRAVAIAGKIRLSDQDYRDVVALERQAAAAQQLANRSRQLAECRATALRALAAGNKQEAERAASQWHGLAAEDPELKDFMKRLRESTPRSSVVPTGKPAIEHQPPRAGVPGWLWAIGGLLALVLAVLGIRAAIGGGPTPEPVVIIQTVLVDRLITETADANRTAAAGEEGALVATEGIEKQVMAEPAVVPTSTHTPTPSPTPTPTPVPRLGAWVDTVIFLEEPDLDSAVTRLELGDIDVYAYGVWQPDVAWRIFDSRVLAFESAYGNYNDIIFMPSTKPTFNDGRLNPFYSDRIREAMNWLIDRDYICQEIMGGLAIPRLVPVNYASKDAAEMADVIAAIELKYAHDPERAEAVIGDEMRALGAEMVDGKWHYSGEPVVITALIRTEDERLEIGDYVSNLLEDVGFTVERDYRTSAEASPCWLRADPDDGCAHFYTGGWVSTAINRDAGANFAYFYTPAGLPFPPWQAYTPKPAFEDIATRLSSNDFRSLEERRGLLTRALEFALEDSQHLWLKDDVGIAPHAADVALASDVSGSIYGSWLWAQTIRYTGRVGGTMNIAMPSVLTEPWNAIAGTNWVYDMMPIRGIQDSAVVPDPYTGLMLPNRVKRAEVFVEEGLPVERTLDWVTLEFVPEIAVPGDAWADWDAANQVFVTARNRFGGATNARVKVVIHYEEDLFDKARWHDGSPLDLADMVMFMILTFDRAKPESPYYDESTVYDHESFMETFKGWRITSRQPLVIEYYTDDYALDAENNVTNFRAAYPSAYDQGQAAWHSLVPGLRAEASGRAAFSVDKAEDNGVEWTSYIAGPTLEILKERLDAAQANGFIPFEPTLEDYVTAAEAQARYANLQEFYRRNGHFYIGTGPLYLQEAFPVEGTLILQRWEPYPDDASKWDRWASVPIPEVVIEGPGSVSRGSEAVFDVYIELDGQPYPTEDLSMIRYLLLDAAGELAYMGEAERRGEGHYAATVGSDVTGGLPRGSNQFAAVVVSNRVVLPVRETVQFVTQ